ncbi:MAG: glycosyltransferase family 39 protein [Candidatus Saccharibacteria bacterium]
MTFKLFAKHESKVFRWMKDNYILILILSAIIAMAISLTIGLAQSVWFDEAYSIMLAKQPVSEILRLTSLDTHPPLYYLLLSLWGNMFGWGEFALRSLSVLAMGGAVIFSGLLIKKLFGVRAALITLPFVVFAPFLLRYGFEIRMYSVASFIGIAATYILINALEAKKIRQVWLYILYAVFVVLGVYTLYYTVLLWFTHLIWLIWRSYSNKETLLKSNWVKAYLLSVVLFLPWLPTFIKQISNGALAPISQSMTLDNLFGIISFSFLYRPVWQLDPFQSLIIFSVIILLGYLSVRAFKLVSSKQKPYLVLLAMYVVVPVAILTLVGLFRPMYVERYLAHILIGLSMFIGVSVSLVSEKAKKSVRVSLSLLIVVLVAGVIQLSQVGNYNFQRLQKPDINQSVLLINNCDNNNKVLAAGPYVAIELSYYLPNCKIYFYSEVTKLGGGYAALSNSSLRIDNVESQLKDLDTIYYVHYSDPELKMPSNLLLFIKQTPGILKVDQFSQR